MSGDAELLTPTPETPPPVADAAPPVTPPVEMKADDEPDVIEIPTGEKLVPLSALQGARETLKSTKAELASLKEQAGQSAEKDSKIAELQQQIQQLTPYVQAYQAAVQAQQAKPQEPAKPTPEQTAKLERVARALDFYNGDGTLNLSRAQEHLDLVREEASAIAQQQVEPFARQTVQDRSAHMFQRALVTKTKEGVQADPEVLKTVWDRIDPRVTATPEGAAQAFSVALGHSMLLGKVKGKAAAEAIPEPLVVERAGGKDTPTSVSLSDGDRRAARDLGLTDKQYAEELSKMPAGWGKGA